MKNKALADHILNTPFLGISQINLFTLFVFSTWLSFLFSLGIEFIYFRNHYAGLTARIAFFIFSSVSMLWRKRFSNNSRKIIALTNSVLIITAIIMTATGLELDFPFKLVYGEELVFLLFFILLILLFLIFRKEPSHVSLDFGDIEVISDKVNNRIENGCSSGILLLIDVKNFRIINSLYGREYGNNLIRMLSDYLHPKLSPFLEIAYLGGIEFCLWIEGGTKTSLLSELEMMKWYFKKELHKDGRDIDLFFHTAGVKYPGDGINFNQLFSRANMAMEKTQLNEQQTVIFYTPEIGRNLTYENRLFFTVQSALENNKFYICYQEKCDMDGTKVMGLEALARHHSPETGSLSPGVFIPIIHKFNLSIPFTNYIIESVMSDIERIDEIYGDEVSISINIPASYFHFSDFFSYLKEKLLSKHIDPRRIIFEITEDIFIDGFETANRIFQQLRTLGIKISLDDFGTGYSSLSYIQNLLIHEIKIDKSFIDVIARDKKSFILVKSICDIAAANGYQVIAEGVEKQKQVNLLKKTSCSQIQGYIYSKPKKLTEKEPVLSLSY